MKKKKILPAADRNTELVRISGSVLEKVRQRKKKTKVPIKDFIETAILKELNSHF